MPGSVILRPLEANLNKNSTLGKMSPYYTLASGDTKFKSQVCKKAGKSPVWQEPVSLQRADDSVCVLEVRTKRALLPDKKLGSCTINLAELTEEKTQIWHDILNKGKVVGRVLVEASLSPGADGQPEIVIASNEGMALPAIATQSANMLGEGQTGEIIAIEGNRYVSSLGNIPANPVEFKVMEQPMVQGVAPVVSQFENMPAVSNVEINHLGQPVIRGSQLIDNRLADGEASKTQGVRVRHTEFIVDPQDVYQTENDQGDFNLEDIPLERTEDEEIKGRVVFVK